MRAGWVVLATLVSASVGCGGDDGALHGTWLLASLQVDGEPFVIDEPLFMDVTADGFRAATACNWRSGQFGGEILSTLMACLDAKAMLGDRHLGEAFQTEPVLRDDRLVFDAGEVDVVYDRFDVQTAEELFAVLRDPTRFVDESALPSPVTGSVPPDYVALVPVPSLSSEVELFLGQLGESICVVSGTADAVDHTCTAPRFATTQVVAADLPNVGRSLIRVAPIADRFAEAAAARTDLGTYADNVLVVHDDAPVGRHVLTDDTGARLTVVIWPRRAEP